MTTKNIQDVVAEAANTIGNKMQDAGLDAFPVSLWQYNEGMKIITDTLAQLVKEVEAGERGRISKEIGRLIDQWENNIEWDGTLNDGLYSLAHWIQTTPPTSDVIEK